MGRTKSIATKSGASSSKSTDASAARPCLRDIHSEVRELESLDPPPGREPLVGLVVEAEPVQLMERGVVRNPPEVRVWVDLWEAKQVLHVPVTVGRGRRGDRDLRHVTLMDRDDAG